MRATNTKAISYLLCVSGQEGINGEHNVRAPAVQDQAVRVCRQVSEDGELYVCTFKGRTPAFLSSEEPETHPFDIPHKNVFLWRVLYERNVPLCPSCV